ncbi:MAG: Cytidylate kinase [Candidatus Nomurabacteria bacterium GW2011_GWA1_37_20]|uniref:Cytidylate kinase n=1 Tax=Candidatus Nomurabacteria bacterium GW2011_GWA1_37_20 TaxID=1618729 RepID=A0A0G0GNP0_9BACT|nr:MAG: Cytidylate kinase [Candidatus Nomurabacteria bacterium GW2011_GWA1_37_20]
MAKKEIITIAGANGSGKSSTAKKLALQLKFKHFSSGDFMRQIARENNTTLEELAKIAEKENWVDKKLDDYVKQVDLEKKVVIDSRLAFYFIPDSFKVYLDLDPKIAAERMLADMKNNSARHSENEGIIESVEKMAKKSAKRLASERKRYFDLYGIKDHIDHNNFNLIVDTQKNNLGQVVNIIVREYKKWIIKKELS